MIAAYQRISRADGDLGKDGKDKSNSILTDNHELYQFLVARIKVPKEMRVSVLYTEDHVFIKEETRIGGNQDEWFPKSIVNVPESITTTE